MARPQAFLLIGCLVALLALVPSGQAKVHRRLMKAAVNAPGQHHRHHYHGRHLLQNTSGLCASEGPAASATFMNASRVCLKLYSTGAPIRVPADTNTTKWGQLFLLETIPGSSGFIDRDGNTYTVSDTAKAPTNSSELQTIWPLLVVKAQLVNGVVVSFTTELYVPYSTILATMVGSQFVGLLHNAAPRPAGALELVWFRWTLNYEITITDDTRKYGTLLHGTFDNLYNNILDANGTCRPALCSDPTKTSDACKYYIKYFGNSTDMTFNWDPNMHMAMDTELVPIFTATHRQYMARFIDLYELLASASPYEFVPHQYTFINHGTPMRVPQNFSGILAPATPAITCDLA